ncbi:hypothetical protein DL769_004151 [Monosporascus sp. CRB-8-3]|nr:hypothetical protein DL769_004151 [Monosporascus sp. CRB-8-3]
MAQSVRPRLQSEDRREIIDIIDSLRSQGISRYVDLPQIIVSFQEVKISIIAGSDRTDGEREKLSALNPRTDGLDLSKVIDDATEVMGLAGTDKVFCTDILHVEISSPKQPHLTLVDLPGLFLASNKDQSVEDAKLIESLVLSYMSQPRSIVLVVLSAKSEFVLQRVTQRAREKDPNGSCTLGLITNPDTLDQGSESEKAYVEPAQNKDVEFRLRWHVLRNRDFSMRNATIAERDEAEREFFSKGVWTSLSPSHLGVGALRGRLSEALHDRIVVHLSRVLNDIQSRTMDCKSALER